MKKSFKVRLFVHVILITSVVIGANRLIAQYLLTDQLQTRVHEEMGVALKTCEDRFDQAENFLSCFKVIEKGSLFSGISDFYVLCDRAKPSTAEEPSGPCSRLLSVSSFWQGAHVVSREGIDFSQGSIDQESWYAVRLAGRLQGPEVWLDGQQIDLLMKRVWALRDRNTLYVLPTILTMLLGLTLYLMYVMFKPIRSIESNISRLTATNLDQTIILNSPYREFEKFVQVFEDLRVRLNDSFNKARRFASDASHELRTPLTILRGNVERLIHDLPTGSDAQIRMRNMGDEVERLIEITEKLLLLSRAGANSLLQELTDVNLSQMLNQLIKDGRTFQSGLKITSAITPDVVWRCDRTLVHQLIQNLYANAVNYNVAQGWIHVVLTRTSGGIELVVENPAANIPKDLSERAFDRFYRGDASHTRQVDGLGLGLSICAEIAKLHGATLTLQSSERNTVVAQLVVPLQNPQ